MIESKYASYDLLPKLVEILEKQLDKFELKTGKFSNINDLTHLISLDDMV